MKCILSSIISLFVMTFFLCAQNDTMYVISNGVTIGKHKLTEVDSVVLLTNTSEPPALSNWNSNTTGSPDSYSWSKTLSVDYVPQPDSHTCGPTSLKMLMNYYGTTKTIDEICEYMTSIGDDPNDGVNGSTIINAAKYYGFNAAVDIYGSTFLKNAISNNHPVIAAIVIKANENPLYYPGGEVVYTTYNGGHYLVVVGLQAASDGSIEYVIVNDPMVPSGANLRYIWGSFETAWARQDKYMIRLQ